MDAKCNLAKPTMLLLFVGSFIILFAGVCHAASCTHYASPTGSGSWANATNVSTPCSIQTAFANAVADNVVCFRGGTYNTGSDPNDGYVGTVNPAHSGSSGHPITFQAYPGETPIFNCTTSGGNLNCRVIGMGDNPSISWITIDGITVQANNGAAAGSIIVGTSATPSGQGYVVKNCDIDGHTAAPTSYDDNWDGLRIGNASSNVTVTNNRIHGWRRPDWGGQIDNFGAIKIYTCYNCTITNNEIYDSMSAISQKRFAQGVTVAYNYIHDVNVGIELNVNTGYAGHTLNWDIHDNVINIRSGGDFALSSNTDSGSQQTGGMTVHNNTFKNPASGCISFTYLSSGLSGQTLTNSIWNNICLKGNSGAGLQTVRTGTCSNISCFNEADYNQWGTGTFSIRTGVYSTETDYSSLSSWKSSTELVGGGHPGTGDLVSDPLFQNGSGNYSLLNDFKLQANSPCKSAGKGGVDIGANVALVGLSADMKIPSPPSNVR